MHDKFVSCFFNSQRLQGPKHERPMLILNNNENMSTDGTELKQKDSTFGLFKLVIELHFTH